VQPVAKAAVIGRVSADCIDQHIDVGKDHRRPSMMSRREDVSFRSTPGRVPPPRLHTGNFTLGSGRCRGLCWTRINRKPCSIRAVRVSSSALTHALPALAVRRQAGQSYAYV
jgi:hypothetical protein